MDHQRKKKLTNYTIGLIFLSGGIEYAVILPTIWAYLQMLDAEPYFLGLAISAFSFAGLLTGPLFGYWSDRTRQTKPIILFANMFQIAGNFMYFVGGSKWMLLSSRLVAGVGTGAGASIFGYLTRSTASEERATVFAAVMACRQFGLLLFMCLVWILLQIVAVTMYFDLQPPPLARSSKAVPRTSQDVLEEDEVEPLMRHEAGQEEATESGGYGSTTDVERQEPSLGDEYRYVPNGHLADEESADEKEKSPFHDFSSMRDDGNSNHAAVLELWRTGEQHHVFSVWRGGHCGLLPGALPQHSPDGPRHLSSRPGHLQCSLRLVFALPGTASR
nr:uncharacterized protein LOC110089827 isoform X3 [Pogona vitticeps]